MAKDHDIKAPDGFLLGGLRRVRADGTILFQRDYWSAPKEWIGEKIWVHQETFNHYTAIEAAPPGVHIYTARSAGTHVRCEPVDRPSAKPSYRTKANKAWAARTVAAREDRALLRDANSHYSAAQLDEMSTEDIILGR